MTFIPTPIGDIAAIVEKTRSQFIPDVTINDASYRKHHLRQLSTMIGENTKALQDAMYKDLHKPTFESQLFEIDFVQAEISVALLNLDSWMKPEKMSGGHIMQSSTDSLYTIREPLGTALVLGCWNFPITLSLAPVVGALAAGCSVVLKPSELSENTAMLLGELIPKYFPHGLVSVIQGAVPETTALLKHKFDKIFYTGSHVVGKIIMKAAAEHLTPVTLELGGKCPVIVDDTVDPEFVAKRIAWGKYTNHGQICLAPDYVLCTPRMQDALIAGLKKAVVEMYGSDPHSSKDVCRIVNDRHFQRVVGLIEASKSKVVFGGKYEASDRYIDFTVLRDASRADKAMQEEIFGPLLPIVPVDNIKDAVSFVRGGDKPLAMYIFSKDNATVQSVIKSTSSGAVCVNDVVMQVTTHCLPFGGVGCSGTGSYTGKYGFNTFSHERAVMQKDMYLEELVVEKINSVRYAPYNERKLTLLRSLFARTIPTRESAVQTFFNYVLPVGLAAVVTAFLTGLA